MLFFSMIIIDKITRTPVNADAQLKFDQSTGICFSCIEIFSTSYVLCGLRLFNSKLSDKQNKQKNPLPKGYKAEIKILANPGLA